MDYPESRRDLKRAVELGSHSQVDYPEPRRDLKRAVELGSSDERGGAGLSRRVVFRTLSLRLCSAQLCKEQAEEYASCFALAGSPPDSVSLSLLLLKGFLWVHCNTDIIKPGLPE